MVVAKDKNGNERAFSMDIDRIISMEEADPNFTFMGAVEDMGKRCKLSTLNVLCMSVGSSLKEMLAFGFTLEEIADIIVSCMRESGFISATPVSEPSVNTE